MENDLRMIFSCCAYLDLLFLLNKDGEFEVIDFKEYFLRETVENLYTLVRIQMEGLDYSHFMKLMVVLLTAGLHH